MGLRQRADLWATPDQRSVLLRKPAELKAISPIRLVRNNRFSGRPLASFGLRAAHESDPGQQKRRSQHDRENQRGDGSPAET
jgi:hypothetical protein